MVLGAIPSQTYDALGQYFQALSEVGQNTCSIGIRLPCEDRSCFLLLLRFRRQFYAFLGQFLDLFLDSFWTNMWQCVEKHWGAFQVKIGSEIGYVF